MVIIILLLLLILIVLLHYFCKGGTLIENYTNDTSDTDPSTSNTGSDQYTGYSGLQNSQQGPMFLAMKNAANISALNSKLTALKTVPYEITDLSGQVHSNSKALINIGKQIHAVGAASFDQTNSTPPTIPTIPLTPKQQSLLNGASTN